MLREARRQKGLAHGEVPAICILDPDGDIVGHVRRHHGAGPSRHWACYHTRMWEWVDDGVRYGIVGCAVGGAFAVLVAEQLFASGCRLLVNVTSAGQIAEIGQPPYYVLVERALRDEGTSYHYLPPSTFVEADPSLVALGRRALMQAGCRFHVGATWTTDAPFRETADAIARRRSQGILAVEMETAALYAFASARACPLLSVAHVSNQLGCVDGDFEKGEGNGAQGSIVLVKALASTWLRQQPRPIAGMGGTPALVETCSLDM
jgi:uridine phosphorylase